MDLSFAIHLIRSFSVRGYHNCVINMNHRNVQFHWNCKMHSVCNGFFGQILKGKRKFSSQTGSSLRVPTGKKKNSSKLEFSSNFTWKFVETLLFFTVAMVYFAIHFQLSSIHLASFHLFTCSILFFLSRSFFFFFFQ